MRRHRTAVGILLAVGALLTGGLVQAGAAEAAPVATPSGPSAAAHTASATEQHRARAFWTAERMRGATPLDLLLTEQAAKTLKSPEPHGSPTTVAPTPALASFPQAGGPWTGGGAVCHHLGPGVLHLPGAHRLLHRQRRHQPERPAPSSRPGTV
ncbi:hypothetical protein GCM10017687_63440 [Streptomyces echinatus]